MSKIDWLLACRRMYVYLKEDYYSFVIITIKFEGFQY